MNFRRKDLSKDICRLGELVAVAGLCCYLVLSWNYAHQLTTTVWDESGYVYKGYLFAAGEYEPFEDFGPWTNHMPLSFLVPGYIQLWFGPSMQTARVYAVVLGGLTLVGLWLAAYRIGGVWWGAAAVWTVTLNTGWVKVFSQVFAQGLICLLAAWMLALIVGDGRKNWELYLAAGLAGLMVMTRIDLLPVLVLFLLYLARQRGWKTMRWALAFGLLPVVFFHLCYWPEILKLYAYWLPSKVFSQFRSPWREVFLPADFSWRPVSAWWGDRSQLAWFGVETLWESLRANLVSFWSVLLSLIFWPRKIGWKRQSARKLAYFLLAVYLAQMGVHLWASMGGHTCQFSCLIGYLIFFGFFGIVLALLVAANWYDRPLETAGLTQRNLFFALLGISIILQPAPYMVHGLDAETCVEDVTAAHDWVGYELRKAIPAGSTVFWDVKSDMLLLYLPDVELFLPQINYRFTLVDDPEADWAELQRFGWWNKELGDYWIDSADYAVVESRFYDGLWHWDQRVAGGEYEVVLYSANPESCREGISNVIVLRRVGGN